MEKKQLPAHVSAGFSRAEWHDKAWGLYQAKRFSDTQLATVNIHTIRAVFDATYDALAAAAPVAVPDGWKLVPIQPTEEMIESGAEAAREYLEMFDGHSPTVLYKAMIATAPNA